MTISYETHPILAVLDGYPFNLRRIKRCINKEDATEITIDEAINKFSPSHPDSRKSELMMIPDMMEKRACAPAINILDAINTTFGREFAECSKSSFIYIGREQSEAKKDEYEKLLAYNYNEAITCEYSCGDLLHQKSIPSFDFFCCVIMYVDGKEKLYMGYRNTIGNFFYISMTERKFDLILMKRYGFDSMCCFVSKTIMKEERDVDGFNRRAIKAISEMLAGMCFLHETSDMEWATVIHPHKTMKIGNNLFKNDTASYMFYII